MSAAAQKNLFGDDQPDLFDGEEMAAPSSVFRIDPDDVRYQLGLFVDELKELATWPWPRRLVDLLHTQTWPYFFDKLGNPEEAKGWKILLEAEAARLDAATTHYLHE